jgi:PII-like signaling protein
MSGYGAHRRFHKEKRLDASSRERRCGRAPLAMLNGRARMMRIHFGEDDRSEGKPLAIVDTEENFARFLPTVERMVSHGGLIAISDVEVIRYTHRDADS